MEADGWHDTLCRKSDRATRAAGGQFDFLRSATAEGEPTSLVSFRTVRVSTTSEGLLRASLYRIGGTALGSRQRLAQRGRDPHSCFPSALTPRRVEDEGSRLGVLPLYLRHSTRQLQKIAPRRWTERLSGGVTLVLYYAGHEKESHDTLAAFQAQCPRTSLPRTLLPCP